MGGIGREDGDDYLYEPARLLVRPSGGKEPEAREERRGFFARLRPGQAWLTGDVGRAADDIWDSLADANACANSAAAS
jgi:hypothetical protein